MFEEAQVCMTCGRPVDGLIYCSDECESVDSTSPSISSAPSSAYPSPYLPAMHAACTNTDVPALVPSALGHRPQLSVSSSSSGWSAPATDADEDDEEGDPYVYAASAAASDCISLDAPASKPSSGLSYTRRPSTTNHRAMVPLLHRNHSSVFSSTAGAAHSLPSPFYGSGEDDASSLCYSEDLPDESVEHTPSSTQRKRNRVSLPAYFSLLQGPASAGSASPSSSPRPPRRVPSALQALSRSLHASPTTPRVAHASVFSTISSPSHADPSTSQAQEPSSPRGRGRRRERDADARSASSRRDVDRSPPRHLSRTALSAAHQARIDSVEKVAEWVSSSPVIAQRRYTIKPALVPPTHTRRNSSPRPAKPKYGFAEALVLSLRGCAVEDGEGEEGETLVEGHMHEQEGERERRGRRRADELDEPLKAEMPGYGSGRTGLKAREQRGRTGGVRALVR